MLIAVATDIDSQLDATQGAQDFLRLYSVHQKQLYAFIGTFLRDAADIDEVLQETTIILWKKFGEFRANGNFLSWSFGVARLEVLRYVRSAKKGKFPFTNDLIELLADDRHRQLDHLDRRREALTHCLDKLNLRDRSLVESCYRPGVQVKQVAEKLKRPVNAVYQSLSRIRRWLHECITRSVSLQED